jgi:hypothetical protein
MKPINTTFQASILGIAALLMSSAPVHAATGVRLDRPISATIASVPVASPQAQPHAATLFENCTREGMRHGRYSEYSWCEWFSYFHQFKR